MFQVWTRMEILLYKLKAKLDIILEGMGWLLEIFLLH